MTRSPVSLPIHHRGRDLVLTLSPVPRAFTGTLGGLGRIAGATGESSGLHHRSSVVMTLQEKTVIGKPDVDMQAKAWGLTPAEEALVRALMAGTSPAEHAERRGMKISTVRSQVRAVLEKSAHSSIRELIQARME